MTPPKAITVSLEWAKRLKEAGWPQEGYFWWADIGDNQWAVVDPEKSEMSAELFDGFDPTHPEFAAPTGEEILWRLPQKIWTASLHCGPEYPHYYNMPDMRVYYIEPGEKAVSHMVSEDSLANAAASMYCYLSDQNLL